MSGPYHIRPAEYAKNMMAVTTVGNDGWKSRASRLAEALANGRYTHRERAYLMSKHRAQRFVDLYGKGWDACVISRELQAPELPLLQTRLEDDP